MKTPTNRNVKLPIFHVSTVHEPFDVRIYHKECTSLSNSGYQVYYVGRGSNRYDASKIDALFLKERSSRFSRMLFSPWEALQKIRSVSKNGLIHIHDPELIPMAIWAKWKGYSIIYDAHEDLPKQIFSKEWIPSKLRPTISAISRKVLNVSLSLFDGIVTATDSIKETITHSNKITIKNVPLLQESNLFESDINTAKEKYFIYSGDLSKDRGLFNMLEIVATLKIELVLAGRFQDEETEFRARQHEGWKYCRFVGWIPRKELARLQSRALAGFCLLSDKPNHREAWPTKLFEYMMHGIPIIGSNFEQWIELIEKNDCGLCVDFDDLKQQIEAVSFLMNSPKRRKEMGTNGKNLILKSLNWSIEEEKLLDFYNTIIS